MKQQWQEIQDDFYSDPDKHTHLAYSPDSLYSQDLTGHVIKAAGISPTQRVLEVGAGSGRFTLHLAPHCKSLVATDISAPLLNALEKVRGAHPGLETQCLDVFDLPGDLGENTFDVVCGFFILHHLPDHEKLFAALWRTVRPGGRICFLEPNRVNPLFLVQVIVDPEMTWAAEKGMFTFSATRTKQILEKTGFREIRLERCGFFPPPILDRFPGVLGIQRGIERLPLVHRFLPFVILTATKP
ncbi:MAG: class I SAM-dependent methyltransferase [Bacteroidota bacterium]